MAMKTTLVLDTKASYDLLVRTLERRMTDLDHIQKENLERPAGERMTQAQQREIASEHMALETLLRQVT